MFRTNFVPHFINVSYCTYSYPEYISIVFKQRKEETLVRMYYLMHFEISRNSIPTDISKLATRKYMEILLLFPYYCYHTFFLLIWLILQANKRFSVYIHYC